MSDNDPSGIVAAYLRQADATFRNGFDDNETREIFLNNVFEEIIGHEVKLCHKKSTSFILELFIKVSSHENVFQLLKAFSEVFKEVAESQQACHVLQTTLARIVNILSEDGTHTELDNIYKLVLQFCKEIQSDDDFYSWMTHTYSSHILRILFQLLSGVKLSTKQNPKQNESDKDEIILPKDKIPKYFLKYLKKFVSNFEKLDRRKVIEILTHKSGSPSVCVLIKTLSLRSLKKTLRLLCGKIFSSCGLDDESANKTLLILTKDRTGSRVMESMIEFGDRDSCLRIHETICSDPEVFIGLACHQTANFVIQKLLTCKNLKTKFEEMATLILEGLEGVLAEQKFGVIQKLAEQCIIHEDLQKKMIDSLMEAFHCQGHEHKKLMVSLIASYTTCEIFMKEQTEKTPDLENVLYHGSLLLQTLLKFENPLFILRSLTEAPPQHLFVLACDVAGSHLVDAFFKSPAVKLQRRIKWVENMKEYLPRICCSKYGSRVMDNIWRDSPLKIRSNIAEILVTSENDLMSDQFGKHIHKQFGLKQFVQRRQDWESFQNRQNRKRKMFDEFLPDKGSTKKEKIF